MRYPLEPLAAALHIDLGQPGNRTEHHDHLDGLAAIADLAGVTHRCARLWATHGIPEPAADRLATQAGHHPTAIWGHLWWAGAPDDPTDYADDPALHDLDLPAAS